MRYLDICIFTSNRRFMRVLSLFALLIFCVQFGSAQSGSTYQTYKSVMKISAMKDGVNHQWENKTITVVINYQTGETTVKLNNYDFNQNIAPQETEVSEYSYTLSGILPVREIINQKQINQTYVVEMQLINYELSLNQTLKFDLTVTNPGTSQANYRMFVYQGKLYNDEVQLPAFEGFENEVELWINFSGYTIGRN